ncbi:Stk1 family PASTA domain-containing Ser/Thr kinase [Paeniglutamicibacter sp. NPDC012692]|uniref:Stk1 family PASTA domain-containing Ser/Thr kinase n=1 Tax=Paeniglutamicibacter sp. NPDC012692 TaxID=3364388 RepID=UPI0036ACF843
MTGERILNGRYVVGELIGRGGMADVHLGTDQILGRKVAIKLLRPEMARDPMVQARFRREAKAVAGLNHPNIVSVYDTGEENREINGSFVDLPFIVMEYVSGRTLRDLHRAGEITVDLAVDYVLGVLEALQHSHAMGIVHRDIKPANIMVTSQGALKVMDFGIARALADSSSTMTQTQTVVGTAQYLSPEQARGETVDARTDLYSTGCLLYELLTGRPPFTGDSPVAVAYQHVGEHAPAPSTLKTTLPLIYDDVVLKALAKDREDRFADAPAFAVALRNARNGIPLPPEELTAVLPQEPAPATSAFAAIAAEPEQPFHTGHLEPVGAEHHWDEEPMWEQSRSAPVDDYRAKSKKAWTVVLSIIMVLALAVGGLFFYNWMQAEAARNALVTIPSLANMTQVEAEAALTRLELTPKPEDVFSDTVKSGSVVSSNPAAQAQVVKGTAVTLMVSKGPESLKIPTSLAGATEVTARETLKDLGFTIGSVTRQNDPTIPAGSLVGTEPSLGSQVKSGSKIDLILSTGLVVVPQLLNLTEDEARELLSDPKFGLKIIVHEEDAPLGAEVGAIIHQDPDSGSTSPQGGTVTVTVAKEPVVETPTPTDEPTDEPTGEPTDQPTDESTQPEDSTGTDIVPGSFDESSNRSFTGTGNQDNWSRGHGLSDD